MKKIIIITALVIFLLPSFISASPVRLVFTPNIDSLKIVSIQEVEIFIRQKRMEAKTESEKWAVEEGLYREDIKTGNNNFSILVYEWRVGERYVCVCGDDIATADIDGDGLPEFLVQYNDLPNLMMGNSKQLKVITNKVTKAFSVKFQSTVLRIVNESKLNFGKVSAGSLDDYEFSNNLHIITLRRYNVFRRRLNNMKYNIHYHLEGLDGISVIPTKEELEKIRKGEEIKKILGALERIRSDLQVNYLVNEIKKSVTFYITGGPVIKLKELRDLGWKVVEKTPKDEVFILKVYPSQIEDLDTNSKWVVFSRELKWNEWKEY